MVLVWVTEIPASTLFAKQSAIVMYYAVDKAGVAAGESVREDIPSKQATNLGLY